MNTEEKKALKRTKALLKHWETYEPSIAMMTVDMSEGLYFFGIHPLSIDSELDGHGDDLEFLEEFIELCLDFHMGGIYLVDSHNGAYLFDSSYGYFIWDDLGYNVYNFISEDALYENLEVTLDEIREDKGLVDWSENVDKEGNFLGYDECESFEDVDFRQYLIDHQVRLDSYQQYVTLLSLEERESNLECIRRYKEGKGLG